MRLRDISFCCCFAFYLATFQIEESPYAEGAYRLKVAERQALILLRLGLNRHLTIGRLTSLLEYGESVAYLELPHSLRLSSFLLAPQ